MHDKPYALKKYANKVILIVNTASKCGYTKQFEGLQELYEKYQDEGLMILGFPCNQFANQDPLSNDEILEFCTLHYGVSFPMHQKTHVKGSNIHPLFDYLIAHAPLEQNEPIAWNFEKFLLNKQGQVVARYPSNTEPKALENDIKMLLKDALE